MKASDIAYLRQIAGGLKAVSEANKDAVKNSLSPYYEILEKIKSDKEGVTFSGMQRMKNNEALKLATTNIIIYKDNSGMFIPIELKKNTKVKIVEDMFTDNNFGPVIRYKQKSKDVLINSVKDEIRNNDNIKKELKASGLSMTKIFALPSIDEQNNLLKTFGVYSLDNILKNYDVKKETMYRVTKEPYVNDWITDELTKYLKQDYEDLKMVLMSAPSASQTFAQAKKLLSSIEKVLDNYPLDDIFEKDSDASLFFNMSKKEILVPNQEITSENYNQAYHELSIKESDAVRIIKDNNLESKYEIIEKNTLNIFQPSDTLEGLKFGLIDYLSYQAEMKNEYRMKMQAQEQNQKKPTMKLGA